MAAQQLRLENNRRASLLGLVLPLLVLAGGGLFLAVAQSSARRGDASSGWWGAAAGLSLFAGATMATAVAYWSFLPRFFYRDGRLMLQLRLGPPQSVPIDVVECFFLGQGPGEGHFADGQRPEAANLIVRLAERATDWHEREVRPALGSWCDGYITLRGMWCEPLHGDRVAELNRALAEVKRSLGHRA